MYDIAAVRAERDAQREKKPVKPFQFALDGATWQMADPRDLPAAWFTWQMADYVTPIDEIVTCISEDKPRPFPVGLLTTADLDSLVSAWLGADTGESQPPAGS